MSVAEFGTVRGLLSRLRSAARPVRQRLRRRVAFAVSRARMRRIGGGGKRPLDGRILMFSKMRNEALRLPYFLEYYRGLGVDEFFLVDNGSDDGSDEIARSHPDVHVFRTHESFRHYANWTEVLLNRFGRGRWCLAADLDEILVYPGSEVFGLRPLIGHLEATGCSAMQAVLLDMYSDRPIRANAYQAGQDPLEVCRYFDPDFDESIKVWINPDTQQPFRCARPTGNLRKRLFGADVNLSKIPLFKYEARTYVAPGAHAIDGVQMSPVRGAMLHFKYLQDFNERVVDEAGREQHQDNARDYKLYAARVERDNDLNCYWQGSVALKRSDQLLELGIMRSTDGLDALIESQMRANVTAGSSAL
jgi:glycosyltransferase involved in cell wall biosynthesis